MGRSTYVVELSVDPGGQRRGDVLVYASRDAVEAVIRHEIASLTDDAVEDDEPDEPELPERALVWVITRGEAVDVIDLAPFARVPARASGEAPTFDFPGFRERLPPLEGKLLAPGQALRVSMAKVLAGPGARWQRSYLAAMDAALMYGLNDLEQEERYPRLAADPFDPSNTGFQAFLRACLRRAAPQGEFEDEEYMVEVLWSCPGDPSKPVKGQRTGHLLCRDPDDAGRYATFTQAGKRWVWRTGSLEEALGHLPADLAAAARDAVDESPGGSG